MYKLIGFFCHLLIGLATLVVIFVNLFCKFKCLIKIFLYEQVDSQPTILHTARGIDAWTYLEDNVVHGDFLLIKATGFDDSLYAGRRLEIKLLKTMIGKNAILVSYIDKV